ncbi:MAG: 30S ribosome-binding factor RbfA [Bacteroidales bacterium]
MGSIRQNKVARFLQKEIADIFIREAKNLFKGKLITITTVRISPDLSVARVYLSIFPYKEEEKYVEYINQQSKIIRSQLGSNVRHQLRIVPELVFFRDDSIDYADRIDNLLNT